MRHKLVTSGLVIAVMDTFVTLIFCFWSSVSLVQAGWWTRRTIAMPSTSQASALFCQQCLLLWSTVSFRGEKP